MPKIFLPRAAVYGLAFLILFFLTAIIFSQVILKGEAVNVPDLTGKTVAEAKEELKKKDLLLAQGGTEFSDTAARGLILLQDPAPHSRLRVTKVVQVVTSAGSRRVTVPDIENKSLETALQLLKEAGLARGKLTQIHTTRYPAGRVIAQQPAPGEAAERGSPVGLMLSQGGSEARYLMPDLIGLRAERVIARLKSMDFKVADIHYVYYPGQPSGVIVGQFPRSGFRVQKRNLITLEVSR
jgi:beta-lactam-binding protein with PASTA domain